MKRNGGLILPLLFLCEVARVCSSLIINFLLKEVVRLAPDADLESVNDKMVHSHQWPDVVFIPINRKPRQAAFFNQMLLNTVFFFELENQVVSSSGFLPAPFCH